MDAERCVCCGKIIPEGSWVCHKCNTTEIHDATMKTIMVRLNTVTDVTEFVNLCSKCTDDVSVHTGRWIISGKSLMGMFSLNLDNLLKVEFHGDIPNEVMAGIQKYIAEE